MTGDAATTCELCGDAPGCHCPDRLCQACDECGASPGAACEWFCTAPVGPDGPLELAEL